MNNNKKIKAKTTIKIPRWANVILWKLGSKNRKRILKFFGLWTFEDELFEILSEEIQIEIDNEIIKNVKINANKDRT